MLLNRYIAELLMDYNDYKWVKEAKFKRKYNLPDKPLYDLGEATNYC